MFSNVNAPLTAGVNVAPMQQMPYCYSAPAYGYCCPDRCHNEFVLIVVLFILLIIVGACAFCG